MALKAKGIDVDAICSQKPAKNQENPNPMKKSSKSSNSISVK